MTTWVLFAVVGCGLGFLLSVTGFALAMLAIVVGYGSIQLAGGATALELILGVVFAAVALQVGYFAAVLIRLAAKRLSGHNTPAQPTSAKDTADRHGTDRDPSLRVVD